MPRKKKETASVTVFPGNSQPSTSVIAPEPADAEPVTLPGPEVAIEALRRIGELNDQARAAHAKYLESAERTKQLRGKWQQLAEALQEEIKTATHPAQPTLFDASQAEHDLQALEKAAGASQEPTSDGPGGIAPPESSNAPTEAPSASGMVF